MKKIVLSLVLLIWGLSACTYNKSENNEKFIEVTGSSEMEVAPDEIHFMINISEYWKEEFEHKKPKDYKTKVPIAEIETNLMNMLEKLGIKKEDITVQNVGNYWRDEGHEALIGKSFDIKLNDFVKVNEITKAIDKKGVESMNIGNLDNTKIREYRKQVKIEALKAAKTKAEDLLSGIDKKLGSVISIEEVNNDNYWGSVAGNNGRISNSAIYEDVDKSNNQSNNLRKIKLRYEIRAKFEIK